VENNSWAVHREFVKRRPTHRCTRGGAVCWPGTKVAYLPASRVVTAAA
jgi:hypothetical protein